MSEPDAPLDVLIVGAGPTGLTLAGQLRELGASLRIVDRSADRVHESRALAIQPRTLEVLRGLEVSETLIERGNDAIAVRLHLGRRVVPFRLFDIGIEDTAFPFILFLSQAETEAVLSERLAARGVRVERRVEFVGFEAGEDDVACTLRHRDGREERARVRYLAGCDGAHSTVRHAAGIPFEGGAYPQTFALADLEVDGGLEPGSVHAFPAERGIMFFFPLGRPATWRMIAMRPEPAGRGGDAPEVSEAPLDELQAIVDRYAGGRLRLRDPAWATYFRVHHRHAARYRAGRVFLAGDAAHIHSPAGAQGMNTGIQDAWNLGWKLALAARGVADEALLDSYEAERRPVGRFVLRFTDRAFAAATSTNPLARLIRARVIPRVLPLLLRFRSGRALAFRTVSQLGIRYRRSPAVEEGEPALRGGPKAGDRLPDARIERDGRKRRLQEALAAPRHHLLLCGPPDGWDEDRLRAAHERYGGLLVVHRLSREAAPGVLHDVHGEAFARLGVKRAAQYLVRPDGHIGFRCGATELRGVERHLARWLPGAGTTPG